MHTTIQGQMMKKIICDVEMKIVDYLDENGDDYYLWRDYYRDFIGGEYNHTESLCNKYWSTQEKATPAMALMIKSIYRKYKNN